MPVGASLSGGRLSQEVAEASDVILIHANNLTRQEYYNMIKIARSWGLDKPIVWKNGSLVDTAYCDPFMVQNDITWIQLPWIMDAEDKEWVAKIFLVSGEQLERSVQL
ncbi:hypothetical protein [Paenibacillus agricola]|uniref:Uncharacterized protein n=1 Tax=Paenibacillus agricola TaxID=2716264 RepID=A0ABX0J8F7_9BACL|nr:hypothetical protein [Paenibacillus agricola]NHN32432.1 hypothetical protein [Paenibacillus agricola]